MARDERVDALRGFALFGILAVNIQCFVTGLNAPSLGFLDQGSSVADHLTVFFTALLLEFKFYPLFSFCFGYGFAVQTRRWAARGDAVGPRFKRRMNAMLFIGMLHGGLLWFGDILTRYAIAGHILRRYAGHGPRRLLKAVKFWFAGALVLMVIFVSLMVLGTWSETVAEATARAREFQAEGERVLTAYSNGNYVEATTLRIREYFVVTTGFIMLIPHVMVLFLLGAMTAQLGLLRKPDRYRRFWQKMMRLGLWVGIPINLIYAWLHWQDSMQSGSPSDSVVIMVTGDFAPLLSVAIIAAFALYGDSSPGRRIVRLLAPAGRIALTLYVSQSLAMALLLSGFGFGWGATSGPAKLLALAAALYVAQIAVSHVMQHYGIPGPLEILWRRYTYAMTPINKPRD